MDQTRSMQALANVRQVIASRGFPLMTQRKCNGILNAMAMQIEDGEYSIEVVEHLGDALLALATAYQVERQPVEEALSELYRRLS
jgi:hypothetical protein